MTAKTFRRVKARTNEPHSGPETGPHPGARVVSHGAVKTALSLWRPSPTSREAASAAMVSNELILLRGATGSLAKVRGSGLRRGGQER